MMLPFLLACVAPEAGPTSETAEASGSVAPCPDLPPPALATERWEVTGPVPATGLHTFATDGGSPIWLASHSTGNWKAGDDLAWTELRVGVTHNSSELALRPGDPEQLVRSAGGQAERTSDGGLTWESLPLGDVDVPPARKVQALAYAPWNPDRLLAIQEDGVASFSEDDGDSWTTAGYAPIHEPPETEDQFMVYGWRLLPDVSEGGRVIFGDGQGIAVSDDGMVSWVRTLDTPLGGYSLLRDPLDPKHLLVGSPDGLYESRDEGSTWTLRDIGGDGITAAWATDGSWLAIVGTRDLLVSDDAGASFTARPHAISMPMGAAILDDGRLLVTDHDGVTVSPDRGLTWQDASAGLEDDGMTVVVSDPLCPARVWAGSRCGGGLFVSEDYGATWAPVHEYFHYVMAVHPDPTVDGRVWAVSDDRLLLSEDGGVSWSESWRQYHFHGFTTHPDNPDALLLGSVGDGEFADETMRVYRSDDGGATWSDSSTGLPTSAASAHAIVRWPGVPEVVVLGTYRGGDVSHRTGSGIGLFRSEDGGATWAAVDLAVVDVSTLAATEDAVFAATEAGIWRSVDLGATWESVPGPTGEVLAVGFGPAGTPGADVGLALDIAGTAWESYDGGATWEAHSESLAVNPTSMLEAVSVSADGTVGYATVFDHGVWRIGL